jgi:hypothetical protein
MGLGLLTVLVVPGSAWPPLRTPAEEEEEDRYDEEEEDEDDQHCDEEEVDEVDGENKACNRFQNIAIISVISDMVKAGYRG